MFLDWLTRFPVLWRKASESSSKRKATPSGIFCPREWNGLEYTSDLAIGAISRLDSGNPWPQNQRREIGARLEVEFHWDQSRQIARLVLLDVTLNSPFSNHSLVAECPMMK
jgi:hypothetical protein